jgi:DNA-binding CsgD family transcriptional regulator
MRYEERTQGWASNKWKRIGQLLEIESRSPATSFGYLVSILGFGLCRAWIIISLSLSLVDMHFTSSWVFLLAGALAALAIPLIMRRLPWLSVAPSPVLFRITAGFLLAGALLVPCALLLNTWLLLVVGWIIGGLGAGFLQMLWGERFAAYPLRFSLMVAPAAAILTAVVVALSVNGATLLGLFVFPLVSFVLLVFAVDGSDFGHTVFAFGPGRKKPGAYSGASSRADSHDSAPIPKQSLGIAVWKLMFSILAFSFICRSFDALPLENTALHEIFGGSVLLALVVVGSTFLVLSLLLKDRFNVTMTYRLGLPLMMIGFAVLAFFLNSYAALSLLLINMGYEFFDILSWILFGEIARREKRSAYMVFGLGVAFTFTGMALAYFFGDMLIALLIHDETLIMGIVLLSMVALALVAFLVIPEGTILQLAGMLKPERGDAEEPGTDKDVDGHASATLGGGAGAGADGAKNPDRTSVSFDHACKDVALEFGLTEREGEVLGLLGRGRTLVIISRELQIAKGTARTHIERIYTKLGVHKQQELIDLVEIRLHASQRELTAQPDAGSKKEQGNGC